MDALWGAGRSGGGGLGGGGKIEGKAMVVRMGSLYLDGLRKEIS